MFIGTECPLVNLYVGRLAEMQREYGPRGLQILAVNSNGHDSVEAIAKHAASRHLPFPVLVDADQRVADRLKAARTPEAILLDAGWIVRYRGRIDDQYAVGADRRSPLRHDLKEAIIDVLAGKTVRVAETKVEGCFISRAVAPAPQEPERQVTYCRDVAPIIQKHCQECHRPGQVAPFSLLTYAQARSWSATIRAVVKSERMPPWNADPRHGGAGSLFVEVSRAFLHTGTLAAGGGRGLTQFDIFARYLFSVDLPMPKIDLAAVPERKGTGYPPQFNAMSADRVRQRLGDAGGLRDFGINLMRLPPGTWSAQRHWHTHEDEFVYVLEGEVTLVEDEGETPLRAGECAAFAKNSGNGHHLINKSGAMAVYLEVGSRQREDITYCSDVDMMSTNADGRFTRKDGTPY